MLERFAPSDMREMFGDNPHVNVNAKHMY